MATFDILDLKEAQLRYLVIDADKDMRDLLKVVLAPIGQQVLLARDARDALSLAGSEKPDLIIAACGVREGGDDLCRLIRQDPELADTLYVVTTTSSDNKKFLHYFEERCDQIVMKPFRSKDIYVAIQRALKRRSVSNLTKIHVLYKEGYADFVEPQTLNQLIMDNQIVCFRRRAGVAVLGRDPIRKSRNVPYSGHERRRPAM